MIHSIVLFEIEKATLYRSRNKWLIYFKSLAFLIFLTLNILLSYLGNVFLGLKTNVNHTSVNDHENDAICIEIPN